MKGKKTKRKTPPSIKTLQTALLINAGKCRWAQSEQAFVHRRAVGWRGAVWSDEGVLGELIKDRFCCWRSVFNSLSFSKVGGGGYHLHQLLKWGKHIRKATLDEICTCARLLNHLSVITPTPESRTIWRITNWIFSLKVLIIFLAG